MGRFWEGSSFKMTGSATNAIPNEAAVMNTKSLAANVAWQAEPLSNCEIGRRSGTRREVR
jgi:hypothetical protein